MLTMKTMLWVEVTILLTCMNLISINTNIHLLQYHCTLRCINHGQIKAVSHSRCVWCFVFICVSIFYVSVFSEAFKAFFV